MMCSVFFLFLDKQQVATMLQRHNRLFNNKSAHCPIQVEAVSCSETAIDENVITVDKAQN